MRHNENLRPVWWKKKRENQTTIIKQKNQDTRDTLHNLFNLRRKETSYQTYSTHQQILCDIHNEWQTNFAKRSQHMLNMAPHEILSSLQRRYLAALWQKFRLKQYVNVFSMFYHVFTINSIVLKIAVECINILDTVLK